MTNSVYVALGTNLGQRQENLQRAVQALGGIMAVETISAVYETEPWGLSEQPDFFNACLGGETILEPLEFLARCKEIERQIGREPGVRWGPRLIDIDLLFLGDHLLNEPGLTLPHPRLEDRAFVLVPLAEIASELIDPRSGRAVSDLVSEVESGTVRRLSAKSVRLRKPSQFAWGTRTFVMGILNVTPDSFSGDGLLSDETAGPVPLTSAIQRAVAQAVEFAVSGADILDIGGESTRPGGQPVSQQEELERVIPVIEAVRAAVDLPLSVDTYRADVAHAALEAGADWVNDVWGLRMDPAMASVVAEAGCPVVIMHNRSKPKNVEQEARLGGRYVGIHYDDLLADIHRELQACVDLALEQGIEPGNIIVDPGIGFGKTVEQNLQLLSEMESLKTLGFPILVGTSRKSFIGYNLNRPPSERVGGTAATVAIAIDRGADVVRVHDVPEMVQVARMTDRIIRRAP